jgi:ammonium transporter, Amt family
MGHNMPLVTIGVFLLWLGWFGFNGGSVLSADPGAVSYVLVTTSLAAAAGIVGAMLTSWIVQKKPDLTMVLNGCLAGLVGITAGRGRGLRAGGGPHRPDRRRAGGVLGAGSSTRSRSTIRWAPSRCTWCAASGARWRWHLGPDKSFMVQLIGVRPTGCSASCAVPDLRLCLKATIGIRVSEEEELRGWTSANTAWKPIRTSRSSLTK